MLPMDAKKNADSYSYPNGMLNSGYVGGVLRNPDPVNGICYIQQTRNENHMLPIAFDPKKTPLPRNIQEGDLIFAICHASGERKEDQRIVHMKSISFEQPNTMHLDKRFADDLLRKWGSLVHAAAKDSGTPDSIRKLEEQFGRSSDTQARLDSIDWRVLGLNKNATNTVRLAGFIQAKSLEQNRVGPDGKPLNDRLVVLLRQTKDPDKSIAIRWYSKNLRPLAEKLHRGIPISVSGEFRLDVKAIAPPDPDSGIAPVSSIPFIQAKDFPSPVAPGSDLIRVIPSWAAELFERPTQREVEASAPSSDAERQALFAAIQPSAT
ncbi:hypothetical protein ACUXAV_006592 [Cupriavidus metallidurans]|jgi:hypothetical protein|uniref:hypothetical protein n=1 Tax=Cupriavidus TaxID=106589 RepID=UPI0004936DD1|nr:MULTISPECIES: hypothetical protein [Cupriavidus]MCA3187700.1 hypothetical protein [Cupriavidus sp.]MCA3194149.1 hypothetical protein [Cupriavidus sp.]MCA3235680.1 hypothetical protein [Cupriavidus sp.]MDE4922499.1 hypothetical protein [Cupriavidus metallidurans]GMG94872.1 hypothetical protein Cmtc_60920 [Cupriavidus sp. TKC]